jgi:hypothetical protein
MNNSSSGVKVNSILDTSLYQDGNSLIENHSSMLILPSVKNNLKVSQRNRGLSKDILNLIETKSNYEGN